MTSIQKPLKSVLIITSASAISQAILFLISPFITRLYTPGDLGIYTMYTSLVGFLSMVSALHLELAIPLPESRDEACLVSLIAYLVVCMIVLFMSGLTWAHFSVSLYKAKSDIVSFLRIFMPLGILIAGFTIISSTIHIRNQNFTLLSQARLVYAFSFAPLQLILGFLHCGAIGLIISSLIARCLELGSLWRKQFFHFIYPAFNMLGKHNIFLVLSKYRNFPLATVPASLANSAASYLPPVILGYLHGTSIAGYYGLAFRVLQLPFSLLGSSLSKVFFAHASEAHRKGRLDQITVSFLRANFTFSIYTFPFLAIVCPDLFDIVFGQKWRMAGIYAQYLMPLLCLTFLNTTFSMLVSILGLQKKELIFNLFFALSVIIPLITTFSFAIQIKLLLASIAGSLVLLAKLVWLIVCACVRKEYILPWMFYDIVISVTISILFYCLSSLMKNTLFILLLFCFTLLSLHCYIFFCTSAYSLETSEN
ncbi:MAG: oligosaccharide flippase family protein [Acetomicrobium sp.]|nr:oligosaccharide flippase family protein [Acetomicrobium sp.]